ANSYQDVEELLQYPCVDAKPHRDLLYRPRPGRDHFEHAEFRCDHNRASNDDRVEGIDDGGRGKVTETCQPLEHLLPYCLNLHLVRPIGGPDTKVPVCATYASQSGEPSGIEHLRLAYTIVKCAKPNSIRELSGTMHRMRSPV